MGKIIETTCKAYKCECGEQVIMLNIFRTGSGGHLTEHRGRGARCKCGIVYARENTSLIVEAFSMLPNIRGMLFRSIGEIDLEKHSVPLQ